MCNRRRSDDCTRAQSEVLGYAFVFSIVIAATVVAVLFGMTALDQVQSSTAADNGEVGMRSVAEDLDALALGTATTRTSELTLESATLRTGPRTSFNVTGQLVDVSGLTVSPVTPGNKRSLNRTFRPIVYSTDNVDIVYENSLLIRDQQRGEVAVNDPLLTASENRTVVPVVATNSTIQSVSGGTHQVYAVRNAGDGLSMTNASTGLGDYRVAVNITVETLPDRATVWKRTLEEELEGVPTPGGSGDACVRLRDSAVGCDFLTARLITSGANVTYEFN